MSAYAISSRGLAPRRMPQGVLTPMNTLLFGAGEQGVWYDPNDLSTQFQDSAGTVPVTAVEQPVGKALDKSGRGNHATQSTTTARPVLSARVNILLNTENPAVWAYQGSRFTAGAVGGDGGALLTASVQSLLLAGVHTDYPIGASRADPGRIVRSIEVKAGTATHFRFGSAGNFLIIRVADGVVEVSNNLTSYSVIPASDGYWRISTSTERTAGSWAAVELSNYIAWGIGQTGGVINTAGQIGTTVSVRRPSFAVRGVGDTRDVPYQRVNTATDYDAVSFPKYWKQDGVDDYWTSATGGGGTAGFFFSDVISPLGGAGTVRVLFSDAGTNTGYIVRLNASNQLELAAGNGTTYATVATAATLAVGDINVCQAWDDGTNLNVRIGNGAIASIARPAVSAGTAGFTIGRDNGAASGYFNGRLYGYIYLKDSAATQVKREAVATYQRMQARLP